MLHYASAKRASCALLALSLVLSAPADASAAGSANLAPVCDEAFYVMLDHYGAPTDASVVKSYSLFGASDITDYGTYDSVKNLTDATVPVEAPGTVSFHFGDNAPDRFYFEGKTDEPVALLPWTIGIGYKLNGVPSNAEDLAGKTGTVEMTLDIVPNRSSSEYMANNYLLAATANFNLDDIVSLEAPDAQIQTVGNLRAAMFLILPGEEKHYSLRVGSNDFSFDGFVFVMLPLNSGRLSDIKDLKKDKEDIEDSYDKMNDAVDTLLDSMDGMKKSMDGAAGGLDELNSVREDVHNSSREFYRDIDEFLFDLGDLSVRLKPISGELSATNNMVTDLRLNLNEVNRVLLQTQTDLISMKTTLAELKDGLDELMDATDRLDHDTGSVKNDLSRLHDLSSIGAISTNQNLSDTLSDMSELYEYYQMSVKGAGSEPKGELQDGAVLFDVDVTSATASDAGYSISGSATYGTGTFESFATKQMTAMGYDDEEISMALAVWNNRGLIGKNTESLNSTYKSLDRLLTDLDDVALSDLYDAVFSLSSAGQHGIDRTDTLIDDIDRAIAAIDNMHSTIDGWFPTLQQMLTDLGALTDSLAGSAGSLKDLIAYTEGVMQRNSEPLNDGTKASLENASDLLRKGADAIESTDDFRAAKDALHDLIEDRWNEFDGGKNNLFRVDPDAKPVSLTSADNKNVSSVTVLMRSQEIKESDEQKAAAAVPEKKETVWDRILRMLKDIWNFLTGWMRGGQEAGK